MVILVDDEDRENEGDLVFAAELVTPEHINFMATHARGLICLAMDDAMIDKLELPMMVRDNQASLGTAFTVSIEARHGVSTGISARDRATTIRAAIADDAGPRNDRVARPRVPAARAQGRRARAHRPDRGLGRSRAARRPQAGRRDLRDHARGRRDGAACPSSRSSRPSTACMLLSVADMIAYRLQREQHRALPG